MWSKPLNLHKNISRSRCCLVGQSERPRGWAQPEESAVPWKLFLISRPPDQQDFQGAFKPREHSCRVFLLWPWALHITRLAGISQHEEQPPAGTCPGRTSMGHGPGSRQCSRKGSTLSPAVVWLLGRARDISCLPSIAAFPHAHTKPQLQGRVEEILLLHHFLPVYPTLPAPWPNC